MLARSPKYNGIRLRRTYEIIIDTNIRVDIVKEWLNE
jgi:hypothetical protein